MSSSDFVFEDADYDLLATFSEEYSMSPRVVDSSFTDDGVDALIRDIPIEDFVAMDETGNIANTDFSFPSNPLMTRQHAATFVKNNMIAPATGLFQKQHTITAPVSMPMPMAPPALILIPATSAEAIMTNATATLRATGLQFMHEKGTVFQSLEEFRDTFYGGGDDNGNGAENSFDMAEDDEFDCEEDGSKTGNSSKSSGSGGSKMSSSVAQKNKRKRAVPAVKRHANPDAELIISATDEQMRLLGLDPTSREGKQQRRRIRNRMSAQLHRERKAMYIDALEAFVRLKEGRINELENKVRQLSQQNQLHNITSSASSSAVSGFSSVSGGSSGGSTTAESDTESLSSASCPNSPLTELVSMEANYDELETHTMNRDQPPYKRERTAATVPVIQGNNGTGVNGGTGIRGQGGLLHLLPLLSVICMIALCFSGTQTGNISSFSNFGSSDGNYISSISDSNSFARRELTAVDSNSNSNVGLQLFTRRLTTVSDITALNLELGLDRDQQPHDSPTTDTGTTTAMIPMDMWHSSDNSGREKADLSSSSDIDNSMALWKYTREDLIANLYPKTTYIHSGLSSESSSDRNGVPRKPRYLRSRDSHSSTATPRTTPVVRPMTSSDSANTYSNHDQSNSNALTLTAVHSTTTTSTHGSQHPNAVPVMQMQSRILMESGKALLDPSMTMTRARSLARSGSPGALPTIGAPSSSSSSSDSSTDAIGTDINHLVMLVPTSSVRWGKVWGDSESGTTESLMASMKLDDELYGQTSDHSDTVPDKEEMYVEIVCSIYSAQLVRNATLM